MAGCHGFKTNFLSSSAVTLNTEYAELGRQSINSQDPSSNIHCRCPAEVFGKVEVSRKIWRFLTRLNSPKFEWVKGSYLNSAVCWSEIHRKKNLSGTFQVKSRLNEIKQSLRAHDSTNS